MEEMMDILMERYELAMERMTEIKEESFADRAWEDFFKDMASFCLIVDGYGRFLDAAKEAAQPLSEWQKWNERLYQDILPESYETSYANPAYACKMLGEEYGRLAATLYGEMRAMIIPMAEGRREEVVIRLELFSEFHGAFTCEMEEGGRLPSYEQLRQMLYWYVSDYSDIITRQKIQEMVVAEDNFGAGVIAEYDAENPEYLYHYGEYVSDNERKMAAFMAGLSQEKINTMADTYTEGYRMGFVLGNKDLSKKETVEIRYALGFERMMKRAVENFRAMGLKPVVRRTPVGILQGGGLLKLGAIGANPNKQFDYDHKDDIALILDKGLVNRKLEVNRTYFEEFKEKAYLFAGPAVQETFGEKTFEPVNKKDAPSLSKDQQKLMVEYRSSLGQIQRDYIIEEERSFTIIAFPVPEIGKDFEGIFEDTIKINTLDYMKYRQIQQALIDALDQADYVELKGMNGNTTDLRVSLWKLQNPEKETIFENCVADVNIPVGEVFTSPVLKGTSGVLNVSKVYLNELEYKDLTISFTDGMITSYDCKNFEVEEENKKFIKENLLFHRETLPLGEFAIGTNTTAYVTARKWGIEDKLPILIAEKTGPHFAVGDTCYSHAEEVKVYNPDGKEIVARENEIVAKRKENPAESYFDCHTDITIPYDELGELTAVKKDGTRIPIIEKGRFVLEGAVALNRPLDGEDF